MLRRHPFTITLHFTIEPLSPSFIYFDRLLFTWLKRNLLCHFRVIDIYAPEYTLEYNANWCCRNICKSGRNWRPYFQLHSLTLQFLERRPSVSTEQSFWTGKFISEFPIRIVNRNAAEIGLLTWKFGENSPTPDFKIQDGYSVHEHQVKAVMILFINTFVLFVS